MKKLIVAAKAFLALCMVLPIAALAAEKATKAEAEAMVKKAVAYIKANGPEKSYKEFTAKNPEFISNDLYVVVYDFEGTALRMAPTRRWLARTCRKPRTWTASFTSRSAWSSPGRARRSGRTTNSPTP